MGNTLNKDKQIEEMAKDLENYACMSEFQAEIASKMLYNAGYRKASEVARETVEAIKTEARKKEQYVNDLFGYGGYVIATTDLEDIIRRFMFDNYEYAELKKKYMEEN